MNRQNNINCDNDSYFYNTSLLHFNNLNLLKTNLPNSENLIRSNSDYGYSNQCHKKTIGDRQSLFIRNVNVFNHKGSENVPMHQINFRRRTPVDRNYNSSSVGPGGSDDEALDDYLHVLAKNYDDIDRRIKNAERFVNDRENPDCLLKKGFTSLKNYTSPVEDNKVNYVTELRVNIANSLKKNRHSDLNGLCTNSNMNIKPPIRHLNRSAAEYDRSVLRRRSTPYLVSSIRDLHNSNYSENEKIQNNKKQCNSDLYQVIIPPPKPFGLNNDIVERIIYHKEVQTMDYSVYTNNMSCQSLLEDRAVQTILTEYSNLKKISDVGIETEASFLRENSKVKPDISINNPKSVSSDDFDFTESGQSEQIVKSLRNGHSESLFDNITLKDKITCSPIHEINCCRIKHHSNTFYEKTDQIGNTCDCRKDIPSENTKKRKYMNHNDCDKGKMKSSKEKLENLSDGFESKDGSNNASLEIQRLLENLGSQLQATMSMRVSKFKETKRELPSETSVASFWDNPLNKKDVISTKTVHKYNNVLKSTLKKPPTKAGNVINSELQEIYRTIEKSMKNDKHSKNIHQSSDSENASSDYVKSIIGTLRSESIDSRQNSKLSVTSHTIGLLKNSSSNANVIGDNKSSCNYKISKTFNLTPYDDIIKSFLSPIDRRLKSVASKNDCNIVIDGPINVYDSSSPQTFRNKLMYRCTVYGACKENLDKCVNYLKETFPNTFLKINSRTG